MEYQRTYAGVIKSFPGLAHVRAQFLELSASSELTRESFTVSTSEHKATYGSLEELLVSRFLPEATGCFISMYTENASLYINAFSESASITVDGLTEGQADSLVRYASNSLAISTQGKPKQRPGFPASVFMGYSFDGAGREVADFVGNFLKTLDFDVVTGEPFEAKPVSDKVKTLIRSQGVVLCIFTKPEEGGKAYSEWVRDEATFAAALDRPLFVLVERGIDNIPGIHGDLEYIPFDHNNLGPVLLKLVQGLNALGFRVAVTKKEPRRLLGRLFLR
jgi:hypothetical protein